MYICNPLILRGLVQSVTTELYVSYSRVPQNFIFFHRLDCQLDGGRYTMDPPPSTTVVCVGGENGKIFDFYSVNCLFRESSGELEKLGETW